MPLTGSASAVARGTAFEQRSLSLLQNHLSMALHRVGGASDGGVDLQGWWWLPAIRSPSSPTISGHSTSLDSPSRDSTRRRIRVLAQCKAYVKKTGPSVVRELEGVLYQYRGIESIGASARPIREGPGSEIQEHAVAVLISQSPFTRQTVLRTMSSSVPFLLLHVPEIVPNPTQALPSGEDIYENDGDLGAVLWNAALSGPQGLLRGEYEIRWIRTTNDISAGCSGRPGLWWNGKPMQCWVP